MEKPTMSPDKKQQQKDFVEKVHQLKALARDGGHKVTGLFLGADEYDLAEDYIFSHRVGDSSNFAPMMHNMEVFKVDRQSYFHMLFQ
jgi:hypothetical protein